MLKLYEYFRSGASFRTRIVLNLKGMDYEHVGIHLRRDGGQHRSPFYTELNPQRLVPTLVDGQHVITQSLPIIEYLEELKPNPPILPPGAAGRARVRALAQLIACDVHPLNNLRVLQYLREDLHQDEDAVTKWIHTWHKAGLESLEAMLSTDPATGRYCHGDAPGLADACLIPNVFHAQRFQVKVTDYPTLWEIHQRCLELDAFQRALPDKQPDAE